MERKYGIGAVTGGSNNWQPRNATAWQRERASGPILPMLPERDSLLSRIFGRRYGGGGR